MQHKKMKDLFDSSIDKFAESLPHLQDDTKNVRFDLIMTHPSGGEFHAGFCWCEDSPNHFMWMRCKDCTH